jgi:hypothetical protein
MLLALAAAIAVPWSWSRDPRTPAAELRRNMHQLQLSAEDWAEQHDGRYPESAADLVTLLDGGAGRGVAWEDREDPSADPATFGVLSYACSCGVAYNIKARAGPGEAPMVLTSAP